MSMFVLKYTIVSLGLILATWGLIHQLIVGAAVTLFKDLTQQEARMFVMSWVAQGAFMTFAGILTAVTAFFHSLIDSSALTTLSLTSIALLFLGMHVLISGDKTILRPVRIGAYLEICTGGFILFSILYSQVI